MASAVPAASGEGDGEVGAHGAPARINLAIASSGPNAWKRRDAPRSGLTLGTGRPHVGPRAATGDPSA